MVIKGSFSETRQKDPQEQQEVSPMIEWTPGSYSLMKRSEGEPGPGRRE